MANTINTQLIYVYDNSKILCVQCEQSFCLKIFLFNLIFYYILVQNDVVDLINMIDLNSQILGAGLFDGNPLLFTSKDYLVSLIPDENIR